MWKVFANRDETSPMLTIRKHFEHEHANVWKAEIRRLNVLHISTAKWILGWSSEPLLQEGIMKYIQQPIVSDDQVCFFASPDSFAYYSLNWAGTVCNQKPPLLPTSSVFWSGPCHRWWATWADAPDREHSQSVEGGESTVPSRDDGVLAMFTMSQFCDWLCIF